MYGNRCFTEPLFLRQSDFWLPVKCCGSSEEETFDLTASFAHQIFVLCDLVVVVGGGGSGGGGVCVCIPVAYQNADPVKTL